MRSKWYWALEFAGNIQATLMIGLSAFLFGGIVTDGLTTFEGGGIWVPWVAIPMLAIFAYLIADRLVDDIDRYGNEPGTNSNLYWLLEFGGDAVMMLGFGWLCMVYGSVATVGYITFIENNDWILWSEIPTLAAMAVVVAINIANDVIRYSKEYKTGGKL